MSGAGVFDIAARVIHPFRTDAPRRAWLADFRDSSGGLIDRGVYTIFPEPASYSGEDLVEISCHGNPVLLGSLVERLCEAGARLAAPGEFTRRAFLNGLMDLAQAEAVADLIDAASTEAARGAMRSLSGEFSAAIHALAAQLVELRALTEATLDFPEEEVDTLHREAAAQRLALLRAQLDQVLERSREGSLLRSGIHVVLAGPPNVGKSSLLNRLAGEERAIVTPIAGTTRDALRETILIDGVPLNLVDTAGLRESRDEVERLGVERAQREVARADLLLVVHDCAAPESGPALEAPAAAARIDVFNKVDLAPGFAAPAGRNPAVCVSAKTGAGIEALRQAILQAAGWRSHGESVFLARERHLRALRAAAAHLSGAAERAGQWELFAEELRLSHRELSSITGEFSADDLLGEIFSRFCIGK